MLNAICTYKRTCKVRDLTSAKGATSLLTSGEAATSPARNKAATAHNGYAP